MHVQSLKERLAARAQGINPPEKILVTLSDPPETPASAPTVPETPTPTETAAPSPKKTRAAKPQPTQQVTAGFTLFLDCAPMNAPNAATFEKIIAEANERILAKHEKSHWSFFEFGQGKGILSGTVAELLEEYKPQIVIVSNSSMPEAEICRTVLFERANAVVMSTK